MKLKTNSYQLKAILGFTLIEVLVAVTIIAVLAAVAITSYSGITKSSRDARRKADLEQVRSALEVYRSQVGWYPHPVEGGYVDFSDADLVAALVNGGYIQAMPADPLPTDHPDYLPYMYQVTDLAAGNYYGYCLEANLEGAAPVNNTGCTLDTDYDYALRNP